MSVSVVVPCYRSAQTLGPLVERLLPVLDELGREHEVLLVVDGSPDDTWDVAAALAEKHRAVRALRLSRNYGQHNALLAGIRRARFDTTVTMDDDLQHPPEEIPKLLAALDESNELAYGVSRVEEHGFARSAASRAVKWTLLRGVAIESADSISAFRAFHTYLRDAFEGLSGRDINLDVALSWATTRAVGVTVDMQERTVGRSNYTTKLLVRHAINMILGYSAAPLRFVIYLGLGCGALGVLLLAVILVQYFTGATSVAGYTTIVSVVAIFSSAQLVALGVLGEYIARIHSSGVGRPTYVVREQRD
jgi:undecaprenyl-phosphate 4-deoxy-4-formamido-L-arabinose transferase